MQVQITPMGIRKVTLITIEFHPVMLAFLMLVQMTSVGNSSFNMSCNICRHQQLLFDRYLTSPLIKITFLVNITFIKKDPGILPEYCQSLNYPLYEIQEVGLEARLSGNGVGQMERFGEKCVDREDLLMAGWMLKI